MNNVKERINKLLAMAKHERSNEHEAETAMRMAERLMREHNIELADLEASSGRATQYNWTAVILPCGEYADKPVWWMPQWLGYLSFGVAKFSDCKAEQYNDATHKRCIRFCGDAADIEYAAYLFKMMRDTGYRESRTVRGNFRETFRKSFALRLCSRMETLRKERNTAMQAAKTSTGTALMVVNRKLALRDEQFGSQKVRTANPKLGSDGFRQGAAAADRVQINRPLGGASAKQLN